MSASSPADAARLLGTLLTGTEARQLADRLSDGDSLTAALGAVPPGCRTQVRSLLTTVGTAAAVILRAVEGARSTTTSVEPVWTLPGHLAGSGPLTTSAARLVAGARRSVTCSTFNFQRTSVLWDVLADAAGRPEMNVRVYVDTAAATGTAPTPAEVAAHLHPATVLRTTAFSGKPVRNHAKFLAVDHRFLLVTSANLSWSAEYGNVELGVLHDDPNLADAVEAELRRAEEHLYLREVCLKV